MAIIGNIQSFIRQRVLGGDSKARWPFIPGRYRLFDATAPVVVAGNGAEALAQDLAALETPGICLVATQCRSVGDAEKLIRNISANLAVHSLLVVGESAEHSPALRALLAVLSNDTPSTSDNDPMQRKLKSKLEDVDMQTLLRQVRAIDMLGTTDVDKIVAKISELASEANRPNTGFRTSAEEDDDGVERVLAANNIAFEHQADKAGNFYICIKGKKIVVEHFSAKNELLRVIEGQNARDLCVTLIRNGWVSKLDHASWLGRELLRAELAMQAGAQFVPDRTVTLQLGEEELTRH